MLKEDVHRTKVYLYEFQWFSQNLVNRATNSIDGEMCPFEKTGNIFARLGFWLSSKNCFRLGRNFFAEFDIILETPRRRLY